MRRPVVAALLAGAIVGGLALRGCQRSDNAESTRAVPPVTTPPSAAGPGPLEREHGVPVGWSRDERGARAAAVSAVALTGEIARAGFITRADMIAVLASERFAPTLASESSVQLQELLGDLPANGVPAASVLWRELPLTADVVHADSSTASVRVWAVLVVGAPDSGSPRQLWRTVTVDLVWERADWRVDGWTTTSGPTPALANNVPIAALDELAAVTAWPPAGGG